LEILFAVLSSLAISVLDASLATMHVHFYFKVNQTQRFYGIHYVLFKSKVTPRTVVKLIIGGAENVPIHRTLYLDVIMMDYISMHLYLYFIQSPRGKETHTTASSAVYKLSITLNTSIMVTSADPLLQS
jgi:uncharacterized membrane protein